MHGQAFINESKFVHGFQSSAYSSAPSWVIISDKRLGDNNNVRVISMMMVKW
ncbi:unnamed protein product [Prunus brigantina]